MYSAISENIAFRWFCFLTIDDKVFDHSTISYFIERVGNDGFGGIFHRLNKELLRLGLLSRQMYIDSSLVRAIDNLSLSSMSVDEFKEKAVEKIAYSYCESDRSPRTERNPYMNASFRVLREGCP